ncbi:MAG: TauD/TfdA family dioxygenase, partial [Actinobacteria bacterium]|nr:TauD/TfdA family dioxygenase [Actinomycetota bacterium]NIS33197.1 TauD/TfdA family dioxygenase [Actinomycetota bacterium]NIT96714.1 TauD/TfdA family dioxygenase [Actinomycetota bacterium]NIU20408.1 TauD/TfdA family dioxygenase [Actinomycetota bacterium]NIU68112.1 TauD/TfdA family dioxygenase [Actinomycetota bacterium]
MTTMTDLDLTPLTGRIAAEVGAPLDLLLTDESAQAALRDALVEHQVLVLRGAAPSPEQQIALAEVFGTPEPPQP